MAVTTYFILALAVASRTFAATCSASKATTITNPAGVTSLAACQTYTGDVVIQSGAADGQNSVNLDGIKILDGDFVYSGDDVVQTFSAGNLQSVHNFELSNLTALATLNMPALNSAQNLSLLSLAVIQTFGFSSSGISSLGGVTVVDTNVDSLQGIEGASTITSLTVSNNQYLSDISLSVSSIQSINIGPNDLANNGQSATFSNLSTADSIILSNCTTVDLSQLSSLTETLGLYGNEFTNFTLPKLKSVGAIVVDNNNKCTTLSFPALTTVNGSQLATVYIANNTQLAGVNSFPQLTTVEGDVRFIGMFSNASLPKISNIKGSLYVDTSSTKFDCTAFNSLGTSVVKGQEKCTFSDKTPTSSGGGSGSGTSSGNPASSSSSIADPLHLSGFVAGTGAVGALLALLL